MLKVPEVIEVEALADAAGVAMSAALARAGVAMSTYWRWKGGHSDPQTKTLRRIRAAIAELSQVAA